MDNDIEKPEELKLLIEVKVKTSKNFQKEHQPLSLADIK